MKRERFGRLGGGKERWGVRMKREGRENCFLQLRERKDKNL
jgi:hypothetical protein